MSRFAIGVGALCLASGWGAGIWAVSGFVSRGGLSGISSRPAPKVVRTPASSIKPLTENIESLYQASRALTPAKVVSLKKRIARDPGDTRTRVLLLNYSFFALDDESLQRLHDEQVIWFAANLPNSPVLAEPEVGLDNFSNGNTYALAKRLYEEALVKFPRDPKVKANYAALVLIPEKAHAIELLTAAAALEPKNPKHYERLGFAHYLASQVYNGDPDPGEASLAVDAYAKARSLQGRVTDQMFFESMFNAGRYGEAEREADTIIRAHNQSDALHAAHTILGRIALKKGDLNLAKRHLLQSAEVSGSPVLDSFGPTMQLAKELLAHGERSAVKEYLEASSKFWEDERQVRWLGQLKAGQTPDWD